jgi:hypothetical protein
MNTITWIRLKRGAYISADSRFGIAYYTLQNDGRHTGWYLTDTHTSRYTHFVAKRKALCYAKVAAESILHGERKVVESKESV